MAHFPELERLGCSRSDFDAVIFDFDGTLADSMWVWSDIDRRFCEEYHLELPDDYADNIVGLGFEGTAAYFIDELGLQMSLEDCCQAFNDLAHERYATQVMLKPGAKEYLRVLAERQVPCGIASSLNIELLSAALENNGVQDRFPVIRLCDDYSTHKSEPKIYQVTAEALGAKLENCLVFEDIVPGTRSAKRAGAAAVAVLDDENEAQNTALVASIADAAIRDYYELLDALAKA